MLRRGRHGGGDVLANAVLIDRQPRQQGGLQNRQANGVPGKKMLLPWLGFVQSQRWGRLMAGNAEALDRHLAVGSPLPAPAMLATPAPARRALAGAGTAFVRPGGATPPR